jgi:nucleoside-diphosphate-sugar epimerase
LFLYKCILSLQQVPNPNWPENKAIDEGSWTDVEYCKLRGKWYPVSKTEAEKAAWEFCEKHGGVDVVAVHPGTCLGPLLQNQMNASSAVLQRLMIGEKDTQECYWLGAVHVKDVARAHVLVYETPTAAGRYLCVNGIYQFSSFAKIVSELYPDFPIHRLVCCFISFPCHVMFSSCLKPFIIEITFVSLV